MLVHFSSCIIEKDIPMSFTYIYFTQLRFINELVYFNDNSKVVVISILFLVGFTLEENIEESSELSFDIFPRALLEIIIKMGISFLIEIIS